MMWLWSTRNKKNLALDPLSFFKTSSASSTRLDQYKTSSVWYGRNLSALGFYRQVNGGAMEEGAVLTG